MKTIIILIIGLMLWAPLAFAQEAVDPDTLYVLDVPIDVNVKAGAHIVNTKGSPMAGEYEYLHSSFAGSTKIEWDPLPNRFLLESFYFNPKEYFNDLDYAYGDNVMLNVLTRSTFHNLSHVSLGKDDPATASPAFTDFDPFGVYGVQDAMNRFQIRLKTPDFPFHIYLEAKRQVKDGTIQQRFSPFYSGAFSKASRSREIDWQTNETRATVNSHLGPVEVEYSHGAKKFEAGGDKFMTDIGPGAGGSFAHNLVPTLESTSDTVKIHTSHSGRVAAAATVSQGDKENKDSGVKYTYQNAAGDLTFIPWKELTIALKYRHLDVNEDNPAYVTFGGMTSSSSGTGRYVVRNAIGYQKDMMSGLVRFRATQNLTLRIEGTWDSLNHDDWKYTPDQRWMLDDKVSRSTVRIGGTYRLTNKLLMRGDASHQTAVGPDKSVDNTYPDKTDAARAALTWTPKSWFNAMLSGGTVREERSSLAAPFSGTKTTERNQALGTCSFVLGKKTSITPGYSFFQNRTKTALSYADATGSIWSELGVPYADTAHVASLAVSHAVLDAVTVIVEGSRSWSRGEWQNSGVVPGSSGIAQLSGLKSVETEAGVQLQIQHAKHVGTEIQYRYRKIDDILDNALDGTTQIALAMLTLSW